MPIYEYRAAGEACCKLCRDRFEVRQRMNEEALKTCPECEARVMRLISLPFLVREESLDEDDLLDRYAREEADEMGMDEDFAGEDAWE